MTIAIIADIGGTNARFELIEKGEVTANFNYKAADFPDFIAAAQHFLANHAGGARPSIGVFGVAAPIKGDHINMINSPWDLSVRDIKERLNLDTLEVMNDFKAVALGVLHIDPKNVVTLHEGNPKQNRSIGIIGPGTGLGVASLIHNGIDYTAVDGEGGHVTMPATTHREFQIFGELLKHYTHISAERVCSGKGLKNLYAAICAVDGIEPDLSLEGEDIAARGLNKKCPACAESVDLMCAFLGRVAGNLALTLNAESGIYLAGGIPPKWGNYLAQSEFLNQFLSKGRMKDFMDDIPVYMIDHPSIGMVGLRHRAIALGKD